MGIGLKYLKRGSLFKLINNKENEIKSIMKSLKENTNIIYSNLFTDDGFLIAVEDSTFNYDGDHHQSIAAISAGIISLAQSSVEILKSDNFIKQIFIQAGDQLDTEGFTILLQSIIKDVVICVLFPASSKLGVILFELNNTVKKLQKYLLCDQPNDAIESVKSF